MHLTHRGNVAAASAVVTVKVIELVSCRIKAKTVLQLFLFAIDENCSISGF